MIINLCNKFIITIKSKIKDYFFNKLILKKNISNDLNV